MEQAARVAVEQAARASYGRLVAYLSSRSGDVAAAEDALSDAFASALSAWARDGVPAKPEAWLLTAARRKLLDGHRRQQVRTAAQPDLLTLTEDAHKMADTEAFPDERLGLMFACAHPAIDASVRTPLMLQTVLGLEAAEIAGAFLTKPATMAQRLVRAKRKIAAARIPFETPTRGDAPARMADVLQAIYAAYGAGWEDAGSEEAVRHGFAGEAVFLGRLTVSLLPEDAVVLRCEALGLLALMLYCEARRPARRTPEGAFAPLDAQDVRLWDRERIVEAEGHLRRALQDASRQGGLGRFQLEAAIQSAHCARAVTGRTDWAAIVQLYERLMLVAPSLGARVGRAAALGAAVGPDAGLAALDALPAEAIASYQPHWAARAYLLAQAGHGEARTAYDRAIGLSEDEAVRRFLRQKRDAAPPARE